MNDQRLQHQLSLLLRIGISISGALLLVGFILNVFNGSSVTSADLKSGWHIFSILFGGKGMVELLNPIVFLFAGIVVLMLTPIVRVLFTLVGFSLEKDWRYVMISGLVLTVIGFSIAFSIVH